MEFEDLTPDKDFLLNQQTIDILAAQAQADLKQPLEASEAVQQTLAYCIDNYDELLTRLANR